jgi:site-specific DNA-methyltransferase (adenine-specific)
MLAANTVKLIITSPPYWDLKDYGVADQLGSEELYGDYLNGLDDVMKECFRVLHKGCKAAFVVGDVYIPASRDGNYRILPLPCDLIQMAMKAGFDFMGNIIWEKISTTNTSGGGAWMGSTYWPRDGHFTYEHEYIVLLKKRGEGPVVTQEQSEYSKLTKKERTDWFRGSWRIPGDKSNRHPAPFPLEIPRRLIKMYSFWGERVLDPFVGSGTTCIAAERLGRNSVGLDLNINYLEGAEAWLNSEGADVQISYQTKS